MADDDPEMALRRSEDVATPIQEITLLDLGRVESLLPQAELSQLNQLGEAGARGRQEAHRTV
jgi:hypothetical protein